MRKIEFRGINVATDKMMYGDLRVHSLSCGSEIIEIVERIDGFCEISEVNPDTVGQFTGIKDKDGKEIFEGDILKGQYDLLLYKEKFQQQVRWFPLQAKFNVGQSKIIYKIIGNIHENPKLLEKK